MEEFNPLMLKPDPAGPYCEAACRNDINTSVQRVAPKSYLPTYTVNQPVIENHSNVKDVNKILFVGLM